MLEKLAGGDGSGVRVAIIDSGVEADHPWVGGRLVGAYQTVQRGEAHEFDIVETDPGDPVGHGTACAGQIRRYAPNVEIVSIRILGETLQATSDALLAAVRGVPQLKVHLVNLSLSTMRKTLAMDLGFAIDDLYEKYISCICARGYHKTGRAFPTNFANTVAVSYATMPMSSLRFRPFDLVEFDGPGVKVKVAWKGGGTRVVDGSSYACPLVTGLAARALSVERKLTPYELKAVLKEYALLRESGWHQPWMDEVERDPAASEAKA